MATAKDLMTTRPLMVGSGTDILEVVELFNKHHITSAPVQNPLGEILGQITEMNLVKALVLYRSKGDYNKIIHAESLFDPIVFVYENDNVTDVLKQMVRAPTHRLLVKNTKEQIVGIISPKDLLRCILGRSDAGKEVVDRVRALQSEIADLRRRMLEMNSYLKTYDTVFQSGLFGLHSVDQAGRIMFANERLHFNLGYAKGELIGMTLADIYPDEILKLAEAGLKHIMNSGRHNLVLSKMRKKTGELVTVDLASAALRDEKDRFIGTFTLSRLNDTPTDETFNILFE